jgi:hypothetical protein
VSEAVAEDISGTKRKGNVGRWKPQPSRTVMNVTEKTTRTNLCVTASRHVMHVTVHPAIRSFHYASSYTATYSAAPALCTLCLNVTIFVLHT